MEIFILVVLILLTIFVIIGFIGAVMSGVVWQSIVMGILSALGVIAVIFKILQT